MRSAWASLVFEIFAKHIGDSPAARKVSHALLLRFRELSAKQIAKRHELDVELVVLALEECEAIGLLTSRKLGGEPQYLRNRDCESADWCYKRKADGSLLVKSAIRK